MIEWFPVLQMGGGMGGGWWFGFVGPLVGLLVMGMLAYLLWSSITGPRASTRRPGQSADAMETLRERYARGEIDDETFEERAQRLRGR